MSAFVPKSKLELCLTVPKLLLNVLTFASVFLYALPNCNRNLNLALIIFKNVGCTQKKIAGRKRPALVDSSHKVRQGGKGTQPSPIQPQKTNPNF